MRLLVARPVSGLSLSFEIPDALFFLSNALQGFATSLFSMVDFSRFLPPLAHKLIMSVSERGIDTRH